MALCFPRAATRDCAGKLSARSHRGVGSANCFCGVRASLLWPDWSCIARAPSVRGYILRLVEECQEERAQFNC